MVLFFFPQRKMLILNQDSKSEKHHPALAEQNGLCILLHYHP